MPRLIDAPRLRIRSHDGARDAGHGYLKALLELEEAQMPLIRARLAEHLGISNPSVTQYVNRLRDDGLIRFADGPRAPQLALTPEGRRRAVHMVRRHRLAECYLHFALAVDWCGAHLEAALWERVMSDTVTARFDEILGHPRRSPYGNPVPPAGDDDAAYLADIPDVCELGEALARLGPPVASVLCWIGEPAQGDPALLALLHEHALAPGTTLTAEMQHDRVRITIGGSGRRFHVSHEQAAQLFVTAR